MITDSYDHRWVLTVRARFTGLADVPLPGTFAETGASGRVGGKSGA